MSAIHQVGFYEKFGAIVKKYRLQNHLTQLRLAEVVDMSVATIASCERGKPLQLITAFKLIRALEIPLQDVYALYVDNIQTSICPDDYKALQK